MRTTLDIDDDILQAAKELAAAEGVTTGKKISDLARKGLQPAPNDSHATQLRNGIPVFPARGEVITFEHVQELMDKEGI